ncbi:hypothetical protein ACVVG0_003889 [Escherichia coli]|uniref:hypothetical protein n=2 Tax=Escherichia coli TaxID=562 RepID=UPI00225AD892|nr:hypothetical protein [Escherichia coli]MCX3269175.1 hypothetical protein [Escherichia coli]MDT4643335.1 hypothetical protein [Escherichia coli]
MENLLFVMCWIKDHHVMSLTFGVLSAILWIKSATAKVELGKKIVMVTYEDPELNVNLHDFFATARLQSKYNSFAAMSISSTYVLKTFGHCHVCRGGG